MTIVAAADGSALGNPGPAGWAWYVDDDRWAAGGWPSATNNQGELTAVLQLLRATKATGEPLHILCDSQYAINACTTWLAGWKRKGWRKADGIGSDRVHQETCLAGELHDGRRDRFGEGNGEKKPAAEAWRAGLATRPFRR